MKPEKTMQTIDKKARMFLADTIQSYLGGKISNIEFDEIISKIESEDPLIDYCVKYLWFFYDDIKTHTVSVDKNGWDFYWRLILLLRSDCTVVVRKRRIGFKRCLAKDDEEVGILLPFSSFQQIFRIRRQVRQFKKIPYPKLLEDIEVWSEKEEKLMSFVLLFAFPVVIIFKIVGCLFKSEQNIIIGTEAIKGIRTDEKTDQ